MAHWTDGPEYAPHERPDVFVAPEAADLAGPVQDATPTAPAPADQGMPDYADPTAAVPLEGLAPPVTDVRDPHEPFDVASTPMAGWSPTSTLPTNPLVAVGGPASGAPTAAPSPLAPPPHAASPPPALDAAPPRPQMGPDGFPVVAPQGGWGAVHGPHGPRPQEQWAPGRPFPATEAPPTSHVPGPPPVWPPQQPQPPGFGQQPAPWPGQQPHPGQQPWQPGGPGFQPVSIAAMAKGATPGVLICLGLGALVQPLALALLIVASVLASRIRYRTTTIARLFTVSIGAVMALGLVTMVIGRGSFDPFAWYEASAGWAGLANLILVVATPLIVGEALRRGEPPQDRP